MTELPKDAWGRSKAVLGLLAGLSAQELRHRVRAGLTGSVEKLTSSELTTRIEQARLMVDSLGRLKGALMKAGQLLSLDASDVLPPEAMAILAQLQGGAEPVDFDTMSGVMVEELGPAWEQAFDHFERSPAASASIGQVHRASIDGSLVAVKIQYPTVRESIDSDLDVLEKVVSGWLAVSRSKIELAGVFEELRSILHSEADYRRELASQLRFARLLEGDARFVVPRSVPDFSTARVHTMTWIEGQPLGQWIRTEQPASERLWLAEVLLELYCLEFFRWGLVQTDPNFGNFLVQSESRRLALLDFGATLEFEPEFRQRYVQLLRVVASRDTRRIGDEGVAFGLIDPRESREVRELFAQFLEISSEPFAPSRQPFAFKDVDYSERSRDIGRRFVRSLKYSPPPRRLLFLHRKLGGIFQLLKRLQVELDLRPYWERIIEPNA
jgi:aarF domain-containing kinase